MALVDGRRLTDLVRSLEETRHVPGVRSEKLDARHPGAVRKRDASGGDERFELVSVRGQ